MTRQCFSVIIAGGKGTRFWPLSRSRRPKQLLKILSPKTLIRETVDRVLPLAGSKQTLVVTVAEQLNDLTKELRMLPRENFIAEPQGRNTAPCIGLAALDVIARNPHGVMVVLPADHWVADASAFRQALNAAVKFAALSDKLITIGIRPDYPETGYGYILKGDALDRTKVFPAYQVTRFKEKPTEAAARQLIRRGSLWNSGIFVWRASTLLELMRRYQPAIADGLAKIKASAKGKSLARSNPRLRRLIAREYRKLPNLSIDHAVLEKAGSEGKVLTLEASFGWSDVGSWAAVHRMMHRDHAGNAGIGKWLGVGAKNCLIHAPDRLVVLLGIQDAVVVDTPDALLVGDLKRSQEVRELVEELKRRGYGAYTIK
jgi:mannose-1-phosphate guanylyltransferase